MGPLGVSKVMPSMAAISFSVSVPPAFSMAATTARCRRKPARGEEVRRRVEALLVLGHEPVVHRVLREVVVVVDGALHAGIVLVDLHGGQDVAAGRDLDAEALGLQVGDLGQRVLARPDDVDDLLARLVLQRVEQALRRSGEVGGVLRAHIPRTPPSRSGGSRRAPS